ncbi:MAG: hypothetical protein KOO60_07495 [Gemmatimonadales bacterium]|nr:hypothetical protein [Gemmatimonadales bacterium]
MRRWMLCVAVLSLTLAGCAVMHENAAEIEATGEQLQEIAPAVGAFSPEGGLIVLGVGLLAAALGAGLQKKKPKTTKTGGAK